MNHHILIIEDDNHINHMLRTVLTQAGYRCTCAFSGTEAALLLQSQAFDLAVLDLMLPGMTGEEVLAKIRQCSDMPVIVLSAKDELDSKVDMLTLGANDYMTKPFEIKELEARILVQLRQKSHSSPENEPLAHRELVFDSLKMEVRIADMPLPLTAHELKIMELFIRNPGRVFSKNEIYSYAWEDEYLGEDKTIHVHISNIRQKIKKISPDAEYIETVWGLGFKLV